jgi:hypothetical protein
LGTSATPVVGAIDVRMMSITVDTGSKLNGKNFSVWKTTMITTLQAKDLWSLCKAEDVTKENAIRNAEAKSIILNSMDDQQKARVGGDFKTAFALWQKIKSVYEGPEDLRKVRALANFLNLTYKKGERINDYCARYDALLTDLASSGQTMDEAGKIWAFKHSLPEELYNKVDTWQMCNKEGQTAEAIVSLLRNHDQRDHDEDNVALVAYKGRQSNSKGSKNSKSKDSKSKSRDSKPNKPSKDIKCNYCKKKGHKQVDCWKRKAEEDGKNTSAAKVGEELFMAVDSQPSLPPGYWIIDSGASRHMTPERSILDDYAQLVTPLRIVMGDGSAMEALGSGTVCFDKGKLTQVLWVPDLRENLFSVKQSMKQGFNITFNTTKQKVDLIKNGKVVMCGKELNGLFVLRIQPGTNKTDQETALVGATIEEWHKRFAHANQGAIHDLMAKDAVSGLVLERDGKLTCPSCLQGKICRAHHPSRRSLNGIRFAVVLHIDTVGPVQTPSLGGNRYFVLATDEFSGFKFIKFVQNKLQVADMVKGIILLAELVSGKMVKLVYTDNGTEYNNKHLKSWLMKRGTQHEFSTSYTPEQNGLAERANRTIIEGTRTLLSDSKLPEELWCEAANTVVYVTNRMLSTRDKTKTKYELFVGEKPDVSHLRTFGQYAITLVPKHLRQTKWSEKGKLVRFVGYTPRSNTYRFFDEGTNRVFFTCDVKFLPLNHRVERPQVTQGRGDIGARVTFGGKKTDKGRMDVSDETRSHDGRTFIMERSSTPKDKQASISWSDNNTVNYFETQPEYEEIGDPIPSTSADATEEAASPQGRNRTFDLTSSQGSVNDQIHAEIRERTGNRYSSLTPSEFFRSLKPIFVRDTKMTSEQVERAKQRVEQGLDPSPTNPKERERANYALFTLNDEPQTLKAAQESEDWPKWKAAMDEEMAALKANGTWVLVERPPKVRPIKNKWVFKVKLNPDGTIERYKARLVAKGFTQIPNVDFKETFAPVAGMNTIRILFAIATQQQLEVLQFDVKTAFLHGDLDEELFMEPPEGYDYPKNKVCRLVKSLYGLRQAPRQWNHKFNAFLKEFNLQQSKIDRCLYYNDDRTILVVIYVDDGLVAARSKEQIDRLVRYLRENLELKVMDHVESYLGFQVIRKPKSTILLQKPYLEKVLERFNMQNCKPVSTPEEVGVFSAKDSPLLGSEVPYKAAIGSLLYLVTCTRPDIAHAVGIASRTSAPTEAHWQLVKRILRYLAGTRDLGISFRWESSPPELVGYCDADYANDVETRRSTSGYAIFYGKGPIAWRCQRQPIVSLSTTEAEYISGCELVKDLLPIRELMVELRQLEDKPVRVFVDNQSTVAIAKDVAGQQRTKHIDVRHKWLSEQHESGKIKVEFVPGDEQKADMLTKPLHKTKFQANRMYFLSLMALACLFVTVAFGFSFKAVPPVVYVDTGYPYFTGLADYEVHYRERNICSPLFNNVTSRKDWNDRLVKDCNEMFRDSTFLTLKNCGSNNTIKKHLTDLEMKSLGDKALSEKGTNSTRVKRALPAIALVAVEAIGQAGVVYSTVRSTINAYNIDRLNESVKEQRNLLKQAEASLNETISSIKLLDENTKKLADKINYIDESINNYPMVLSRFVFVSTYLEEIKAHLASIDKDLKIYRISSDLVDLVKKPLWKEPASRWSALKTCSVVNGTSSDFALDLKFNMPVLDDEVRILRARSFKVWNQTQPGRFCLTKYTGPRFVLTNVTNNCYDDLDTEQVVEDSVTGFTCDKQDQGLEKIENVFAHQQCLSKPNYHSKEQVIQYGSDNLIYCPGQMISIRDRDYPCPEHVFALPLAESFTLDHYSFRASKRVDTVINTMEKQMNDDIRTSLKIDKVTIIGINSTRLELEYGKLGRLVDSMMSKNMTLMKMPNVSEVLKAPFKAVEEAARSVWNWLEKGLIAASVVAGLGLLIVSMPLIELIYVVTKLGFGLLKRSYVRFLSRFASLTRRSRKHLRMYGSSKRNEPYVLELED